MSDTYTSNFYDIIRPGCQSSAAVVAPMIYNMFHPKTVIDIGCGEGWWAQAFADLGCEVKGVDGEYVATSPLGDRFIAADISQPLPNLGTYDLAICLEVAEHLPESRAASFIYDLTQLAPIVLFSAAIPEQGGAGHINEQWGSYWVKLFQEQNDLWTCDCEFRSWIWDDNRVEPWYCQNIMIATNKDVKHTSHTAPVDIVHPVIYGWKL